SSGLAPGSRIRTLTMGGSALGKRSTPRPTNEKTPSTTRNSTSIVAKTGRRTQISANDIVFISSAHLLYWNLRPARRAASIGEHGGATVFWQAPQVSK